MHTKKILSRTIGALVVVAMLMAMLPVSIVAAQASDVGPALQAGADRLVALQQNDGGWDWPLDDGDPTDASPRNTIGPIGKGLAEAYLYTMDPDHLAALGNAGSLLLSKTNNFSPPDGYLAVALDDIFGGSTYQDHVVTNFYAPLAAGTYDRNGAGTLYDTAGYVDLIQNARSGSNLGLWDIGMGLVGAAACGADTTEWILGVKDEINEFDETLEWDVIGLAGGLYGLSYVGEEFDPTAGDLSTASSLADLASVLVSYQISGGGFAYSSQDVSTDKESIQETAYTVLALNEFDRATYLNSILGAADYMLSVQLGTGGWENNATESGENNEVTGEALWALSVAYPLDELWVCASGSCGHPGAEFATIQEAIDAAAVGATINVAAGTYVDDPWNSDLGTPEGYRITKSVTLKGAQAGVDPEGSTDRGGESILVRTNGTPYSLYASGITIDGFTFTSGSGSGGGRLIIGGDNVTIQNNIIKDVSGTDAHGIWVSSGAEDALIDSNTLSNTAWEAIMVEGEVTISNNTIKDIASNKGIVLNASSNAVVSDNVISTTLYEGIAAFAPATITDNEIYGAYHGIQIRNAVAGWVIEGNDIHDNDYYGIDIPNYGGLEPDVSSALIGANTFANNGFGGISIGGSGDGSGLDINENDFSGQTNNALVTSSLVADADASPNWWGSIAGPASGQVVGDVEFTPWCANAECTAFAPDENGVVTLSGDISVPGGIVVDQPGLTFLLEDGTVIENDSPCFVINADNTKITTTSPLGAVCVPTDGSNGIDVNGDRTNIIIEGLEIDGAAGTNGIDFDGVVTDLIVRDNYIHGLPGAGLFFAAQPAGTVQIQGNLFMDNGGNGIEAGSFAIPAEYNAWGDVDGAGAGDGISAGVDADPWTHVSLSLADTGSTLFEDEVLVTTHSSYDTITYEVKADLKNATGAAFTIGFNPALLQVTAYTEGSVFTVPATGSDVVTYDNVSGTISFDGYSLAEQSGEDLVLFSVTFEGKAAGTSALSFGEDMFGMSPDSGPSVNIYPTELEDGEVLVRDHFTVIGTVSMQGRTERAGVVMTLTAQNYGYGPFSATSTATISNNLTIFEVVEDEYQITITQNRYLDVTVASGKSVDVAGALILNSLELKGGDVNNSNDIGVDDASVVGSDYGTGTIADAGDANFDGRVNIQDLALVGGNYGLASATAYTLWTP